MPVNEPKKPSPRPSLGDGGKASRRSVRNAGRYNKCTARQRNKAVATGSSHSTTSHDTITGVGMVAWKGRQNHVNTPVPDLPPQRKGPEQRLPEQDVVGDAGFNAGCRRFEPGLPLPENGVDTPRTPDGNLSGVHYFPGMWPFCGH